MKIRPYDKLQALKRSEKYRGDYQQYVKDRDASGENDLFIADIYKSDYFKQAGKKCRKNEYMEGARVLSKAGKILCQKWNIRFPVNPDAPYIAGEESMVFAPIAYLDPPETWRRVTSRTGGDGYVECITHVDDKLVLMIDSSYSRDQIRRELERMLKTWTREIKDRAKPSKLGKIGGDIWDAFDKMPEGRHAAKAARKLIEGKRAEERKRDPSTPTTIYLDASDEKCMSDASKKARRIMKAVENQATTVMPIDPMEIKYVDPVINK